jgi:hypothetical protein
MAEKEVPAIDSASNGADGDAVLDKENDLDDEHESEEIVHETVNVPTSRRRNRSKGKTRTFIIPDAASSSDDSEDEPPTSKGSISSIKARPKYPSLNSIQQLSPKSPRQRKAKNAAAARGRGLALSKPDKFAGGDPRQQRRLRRCANQDR